ncbi:MAG: YqaE/Pmp3 family membrane protein [Pedobacter sp.]|nr:YqaE/Pmp3 family membrane protein [Chitinophagaceae bacterium]
MFNAQAISLKPITADSSTVVIKESISDALHEFKSLSHKEKRDRILEAKKALKDFKKNKSSDGNTILLCILAILLPPLAVYLKEGAINSKFWISLLLTLLFFLPGVIYALLVVLNAA